MSNTGKKYILNSAVLHRTKRILEKYKYKLIFFFFTILTDILTTHIHISYMFYNITTVIINKQTPLKVPWKVK